MSRKPKFKPVITRVKLNPEQAVLACDCYDGSVARRASASLTVCVARTRNTTSTCRGTTAAATS